MPALGQGVSLLVIAAVCLGVVSLPVQQRDGDGTTASKMNMHIIVMRENDTNCTAQSLKCNRFLELVSSGRYDGIDSAGRKPAVGRYNFVGIGYIAELDSVAVKMLADMEDVNIVERDQEIWGAAFLYPIQLGYHTDRIDQRELPLDGQYNPPFTGEGVDIYIVDTGISYSHTLFGGRAQFGGYDHYGDDGKDCHGHGTHVAGLAGGSITGAATQANLYSIKVLNCDRKGTYSGLLAGIHHIIERARNYPSRRSIISMSLIGPPSSSVDVALQRAYEAGVITVSAAGNHKDDACDYSPASSQHTITVGGSREKEDGLYWLNGGTNWGKCVDMFAPGQWVRSASHESDDHLVSMSGTSMATPIVSGVVAIMLEEDPSLSPDEVKERMQERATKGALDFSVLPATVASDTPNLLVYTGRREPDPTSAPTTQDTTTPTTQTTTTPTTQATAQPKGDSSSCPPPPPSPPSTKNLPTLQPQPDSGMKDPSLWQSRISVNLSVEEAFRDAFVNWAEGYIPESVNAYTKGTVNLAIVYRYVGLDMIKDYIFDLLPMKDLEVLLSVLQGWSLVAIAPYANENGEIHAFCVLKYDSGDRVLVMEKTVEDFFVEDEEKRKQGYGPISLRFSNSVQDGTRVYAIYEKHAQTVSAVDLSLPALRSRAYQEWVNGHLITDLSYQFHEDKRTSYSAVFTKPQQSVASFYTDVRHNADRLTFINTILRKSDYHAAAMTPIFNISGSISDVGFFTAYWRILK